MTAPNASTMQMTPPRYQLNFSGNFFLFFLCSTTKYQKTFSRKNADFFAVKLQQTHIKQILESKVYQKATLQMHLIKCHGDSGFKKSSLHSSVTTGEGAHQAGLGRDNLETSVGAT